MQDVATSIQSNAPEIHRVILFTKSIYSPSPPPLSTGSIKDADPLDPDHTVTPDPHDPALVSRAIRFRSRWGLRK